VLGFENFNSFADVKMMITTIDIILADTQKLRKMQALLSTVRGSQTSNYITESLIN
jgi:hypothetical protein